jgi:hypothetical protein
VAKHVLITGIKGQDGVGSCPEVIGHDYKDRV